MLTTGHVLAKTMGLR